MRLYRNADIGLSQFHTCCSQKDIDDASEVAFQLDIPYEVLDFTMAVSYTHLDVYNRQELDPPVDDDSAGFWEGVQALRGSGADAVTIADCPIGRPRADSSLLACKIKRDIGIEPLPHMTCRDRNLNATKALLLGLSLIHI